MANRYWVGGTGTWNTTSTTNWSASSGGASGASVPTTADSVFFDQAGTYTVTMTGALNCLDLTVSAGTVTFATGTTPTLTVAGNWSTTANTVWNSTGTITFSSTTAKTINTNGITMDCSVTITGAGGTKTLLSNLTLSATTATRTLTLNSGTLALDTYTLTCGIFSSSTSNTRAISFGTGKIVLNRNATATIWNTSTSTGLTITGSALVESLGGGTGVTKTFSTGSPSANLINISLLETTGTVTYSIGNRIGSLLLDGLQTLNNTPLTIYGNFTHLTTRTTTITTGANTWEFFGVSGVNSTITPASGVTYNFPWTFNGVDSTVTFTLAGNLTVGNTRTVSLLEGTLALSTYTLTCGAFNSNGALARSLDFGTGKIILNGTATATIWDITDDSNFTASGTRLVECTGAGTGVTKTIITGVIDSTQAVSFSLLSPSGTSTYLFSSGSAVSTLPSVYNFTCNGAQTVTISNSLQIFGSFTHSTAGGTTSFSTTGSPAFAFSTPVGNSATITTPAGFTYAFPWALTSTNNDSITLNSNVTTSNTFSFHKGTFSLSSYTLTVRSFVSGEVTEQARTLDFGTGKIVLNTALVTTIWDLTYSSLLTITGSRTVECIGGGSAITKTIYTSNNNDAVCSFSFFETAGTVTYLVYNNAGLSNNASFKNLICNGVQTISFPQGIAVIDGEFTHANTSGTTTFSGTNFYFYSTGGTYSINSLTGYSYPFNMVFGATFSGYPGTFLLTKNLIASDISLRSGALSLNTYTFSTNGTFSSSGTQPKTLDFGTGKIVLNGNTTQTIWNVTDGIYLSIAGTSLVECSGGGTSVTKTIINTGVVEAGAVNFSLIETTGSATYSFSGSIRNLNLNGSQTITSVNLYGNYTYNNTSGTTTLGSSIRFVGSSGTQTITSNGIAQATSFNVDTSGATVQLNGNLTLSTTRQLLLTNGAFDFNNNTLTVGTGNIQVQAASNQVTISNTGGSSSAITNAAVAHQTGTLLLGSNITTTGDYTFTAGTLSLTTYTLTAPTFTSTGTGTRTLAYGTGQLALTGSGTTILDLSVTGLTSTGTVYINCTYTGSVGTRLLSLLQFTQATIAGYNLSTSGNSGIVLSPLATDTITIAGGTSSLNNIDLTGFSGTLTNNPIRIYGNLTLPSSGGTYNSGTSAWRFASTSGTKTIVSNGRTINWPFTFDGVGGRWSLSDALTLGVNGTITQTNGTLDLNGKTLTTAGQYLTATGTKNLTFNGGTLMILRGTAGFNNASPTNYTTTAGVGTGEINMAATGGVTKGFTGGGSTYNCVLNNSTSGQLSISGNNTFITIKNSTQPTTFQFASGSTTTVTNWDISGTAGNLVTIRSSTSGSAHTLSKSTGTVSSNYLSISDSTATGGATWYAGANSVDGGNNSGWIFSGPPLGPSSGAFLLMFN